MTIAIDFDNTIANTDESVIRHPRIVGLVDHAKEVIQQLHDDGHLIIINTCRHAGNLQLAQDFLDENGVYYDLINANDPNFIKNSKRDTRKIFADVYIDDRNIGGIPTWPEIYSIIKAKSENNE